MKTVLLAMAGAIALAGPALAADAPRPAPVTMEQAPPVVYARDWSGPYLGLQVGYGWADADVSTLLIVDPLPVSMDLDGFAGGLHGGWNWQSGSMVFGIDGEFNLADIDGDHTTVVGRADASIDWFGSITGRLGWANESMYIYGTGGFAFARASLDITESGDPTMGDDDTSAGWTIGAGLDYAMSQNWLLGLNYKYYDFGDFDFTIDGAPIDMESDMHVVSLRLTRTFGGQPIY